MRHHFSVTLVDNDFYLHNGAGVHVHVHRCMCTSVWAHVHVYTHTSENPFEDKTSASIYIRWCFEDPYKCDVGGNGLETAVL